MKIIADKVYIFNGGGHAERPRLVFTVFYPSIQLYLKGVTDMVLKDSEKVILSITPKTKKGNPASIDGVPVWQSGDPNILALEPASDGLSAVALANGPLGHAQVNVTADADLGEGVVSIAGVIEVDVMAGQAVSLDIQAGTPEEQ